jgi:hypothetical protein
MKTRSFSLPLLAATLCGALCACSTPYSPPKFLDAGTAFPGLIDIAAQSHGKAADVLLVHGICTHDERWAQETVAQLTQSLKVNAPPPSPPSSAQGQARPAAQVRVLPLPVDISAGRLRFNALIWSPLTQALKGELCYDQGEKSAQCAASPPFTAQRARINALGKDRLVDDCVADALIYQGVSHETMLARMRAAVLQVLDAGGGEEDVPLIVVAESMGSKYLFDTLLRMSREEAGTRAVRVAQRSMDRMRYLVMAANQIPLLGLADQNIDAVMAGRQDGAAPSPAEPAQEPAAAAMPPGSDSLQQLLRMRRERAGAAAAAGAGGVARAADQRLVLVAFTDPNDLLSYTLQTEKYAGDGVVAYNILVSNAPTYFGLLERPDGAHLNYLSNADVGRLVACGQPISKLCK